MKYLIDHIGKIIGGKFLQFAENNEIAHLLTDSRRLVFPATTLFFSLKGDRKNGSQFIDELYHRGVRNFVVFSEMDIAPFKDANIILVKDSLFALQELATHHRSLFDIPVIGITGSNGKTMVKEWLNQLLEDEYHIVRSPRSYNSQIGVPLSVWQMNEAHELAIFEAGISQPGEMERLEKIIKPNIGILTNIGEAHSEGFTNMERKLAEKLALFENAAVVIYCSDHPAVSKSLRHIASHKDMELFSWGKNDLSIVKVAQVNHHGQNTDFDIVYNEEPFSFSIPFADDASFENAMTCICTLLYLKLTPAIINNKLQRLSPVAMRLELKGGINNCSIINDSYSADINSLRIALDFVLQQQQHAKRTVILSDILESGQEESKLYQEVANLLQQKKVNRLIGIGEKISKHKAVFHQIAETVFYDSVNLFKTDFTHLHFRDETILLKGARKFEFETIDRLLAEQIHQTVLEINLNAMADNLKQFQQLLRHSTKIMVMVKAFSYGGGSFEIANMLQFRKVDYLAVAYADEGVELRKSGIGLPIMVMNAESGSFDLLLQYQLEPVIYSFRLLELFDAFLRKEAMPPFPVHIELETGMNRLGFDIGDLQKLIEALKTSCFKIQTVFSHLAASEEAQQDAFTRQQADLFLTAADEIQAVFQYPFLKHIANTAAILRHPDLQLDMVRLGIGLYGIDSSHGQRLRLHEVSVLKSTISQIKHIAAGTTVGYNRKGIAEKDMGIATVGIGYADGYSRKMGNGTGKMMVKGRLAPVIGSICMDMTMIDITGIPDVQEGDEVVVFGPGLPVEQLAKWAQTIPYEILTSVSQRVKRVYFEE
ncbi:MAG: bifunctional UDP-N-acetylmuramoyl-tripeptide:D-alanyl-D-alanine ligase/alanine racemase [Bacteroidetes bacterium]|nr:bifunctional UDP-N-acetylmuramoyl-tripeptide:D-alanyl-D-alanine ligase/alanine racemase [Bacteroidota bacterium]